ncbi:MAG: aminotransferase class I/II-fold pyridoxal phosphate-dependent enzyme [Eubacterium sp.]
MNYGNLTDRSATWNHQNPLLCWPRQKGLQKIDPEILNLTGGEPDFPTPKAICDTVVAELAAGHTHYSDSRGDAQLRARIARKLQEENHAPFQPENILAVTPGGKICQCTPDHPCADQSRR